MKRTIFIVRNELDSPPFYLCLPLRINIRLEFAKRLSPISKRLRIFETFKRPRVIRPNRHRISSTCTSFERIIQYSGLKQETRSTEIHVLLLKLRFQVIFIRVKLGIRSKSGRRGTCVAVYPRFSAPSVRPKLCPRCNISGNVCTSQPPRNQQP